MRCENCEVYEVRAAHLALTLRKLGVWIHAHLGHGAVNWQLCHEEPCVILAERLKYAGIPLYPIQDD